MHEVSDQGAFDSSTETFEFLIKKINGFFKFKKFLRCQKILAKSLNFRKPLKIQICRVEWQVAVLIKLEFAKTFINGIKKSQKTNDDH